MESKFLPPANFAPVEKHLYRSAIPLPGCFPFLRLLGIKTVIWLSIEDPSDEFMDFVELHNISLVHYGILTEDVKPWDFLGEELIEEALVTLMEPETFPVLICCSMGRHRTGAVVGCLRKLQNWSFSSLVDEYQRFTGVGSERMNVELLIEDFNLNGVKQVLKEKKREGKEVPAFFDSADI